MKHLITILLLLITIASFSHAKKTCSQFKDWKQAEAYYKAKKPGYKSLDKNNDGKPCEALWIESLSQEKESIQIRIYQYGSPSGFGKSFSSMSACEKERAKLTKANAGTDHIYKCVNK